MVFLTLGIAAHKKLEQQNTKVVWQRKYNSKKQIAVFVLALLRTYVANNATHLPKYKTKNPIPL